MRKIFFLTMIFILALSLLGCGECRHEWSEADCLVPKVCNLCGEVGGEAPGHEFDTVVTPPTCLYDGYTTHTCKRCGVSETESVVAAHGHTYGKWEVLSPIMPKDTDGEMCAICVNCDNVKTKPLDIIDEGMLGRTVNYTLFEDGTLLLSGQGATLDCAWNGSAQPYAAHRDKVTRAVIGEGITELYGGVFAYMPNLRECEFPSTLRKLNNNTFMDSFTTDVTEFVIPANITDVGVCTVGQYREKNALFTDIYIENPDIDLADTNQYIPFNSSVGNCRDLTLYSHGVNNKVRSFADKYGIKYVDLDSTIMGNIGNLSYNLFDDTLTLTSIDSSANAVIPTTLADDAKINKDLVKKLVIEGNIKEIPDACFKDFTALTSVTLSDSVIDIGAKAFATSHPCTAKLHITLGEKLSSLSPDFLKNRSGVTVDAFKNTAADKFSADGVILNLHGSLKLLLIGNSLSLDAADYLDTSSPSKLYNIIKAMVGDDTYVEIGVLYSGAKSAGWHATVAESDLPVYQFFVISDDTNGKWVANNNYTAKRGLTYDDWDIVTIQPYAAEATSGVGATSDTDTNPQKTSPLKAEKFYPLSASLPYLLDYIDAYCKDAKVYYYLTWSTSSTPQINHAAEKYLPMLETAKVAMRHKGSVSGKGFDGLIPVGTAIQNARSTFLGLVNYKDPSNANFNHTGLSRDGLHLSIEIGRYIAGLSFAELLVPEEYRQSGYALPDISPSALGGSVTPEYTEVARLCVEKMLESCKVEGDAKYKPTEISGYTALP